jgi:tetratricopeptide (TPR) repeat protein
MLTLIGPLLSGVIAFAAAGPGGPDAGSTITSPDQALAAGQSLLQEARERPDPATLERAETAFRTALEGDSTAAEAYAGLGSIALTRHRFGDALELGRQSLELMPASTRALGVVFDAQVELGRYAEAGQTLDAMLAARPDLTSFARLSYFHELHGRLDEAIEAMERAVLSGAPGTEPTEFARVLLADLWLLKGDTGRARMLYESALSTIDDYLPARLGLARVAAADRDDDLAIRLLEGAIAETNEPATLLALGELLEARGDHVAAEAAFRDALIGEAAHRARGEPPEPFGIVMEADHGDVEVALELAWVAYRQAPSIRAADALAWALHRNGRTAEARAYAEEALRTGTLDPGIRRHAAVIRATHEPR